ncbi:hypothetical protein A2U01_0108053, partial [Trifolium medium]|nr:hypothetical protein [Trifolium medium]
ILGKQGSPLEPVVELPGQAEVGIEPVVVQPSVVVRLASSLCVAFRPEPAVSGTDDALLAVAATSPAVVATS